MPSNSGWSDERRARHRTAIQKWKPWTRSTGPRTPAGKHRSSRNAFRHGGRSAMIARYRALLAHHRQWLRLVRAHFDHHIFSENELLAACLIAPDHAVLGDDSGPPCAILGLKEP